MITGLNRIFLSVANSTQIYLKGIVDEGVAKDGDLVMCEAQTQGRGMGGNRWESEPGKNLLFSFVRFPDFLAAGHFFLLNKYVSLAIRDVVQQQLPETPVTIKWPNDIFAGDRKICGMLIENTILGDRFTSSVTGIGLNVNQVVFPAGLPNPVSLKMISGMDHNRDAILDQLCAQLDVRYDQMINQKRKLNHDYLSYLYRRNKWADYEYAGRRIVAKITGVNHYGMLKLQLKSGGAMECDMKAIKFLFDEC